MIATAEPPRRLPTKPFAPRAATKRGDGVWWRTLAYCDGCGLRMGLTPRPSWCRVKIRLPEFRRNAVCAACIEERAAGSMPPSFPWWFPNRPGWGLPAWAPPIGTGERR